MTKSLFFTKLICILLLTAFGQSAAKAQEAARQPSDDNQINFIENSWPEALKQARLQHKYIFADAYATWCGPCNMLKAITFRNHKAAAFFNQNFINVALDMERGLGPQLAASWGMQAYPTLIIFDADGHPVSGTVGYIGAKKLIRFGQEALAKRAAM